MALLSSPTAQDLLTAVRQKLGERQASNSRWKDDELLDYINNAVQKHFGEVVQNSEGHFTKVTTLGTTTDQETVTLPSDFFEVVSLKKKQGDAHIPLVYETNRESVDYSSTLGGSGYYYPTYRIRGTTLVLNPIPAQTEADALKLEYIAFPDQMVYGGDSLTSDVAPIFKDLIIAYAVYEAKQSENIASDGGSSGGVQAANSHLQMVYSQFRDVVRERSHALDFTRPFNPENM